MAPPAVFAFQAEILGSLTTGEVHTFMEEP